MFGHEMINDFNDSLHRIFTGGEVCPEAIYSKEEIHISGDISWAILQYIYATNDTSIIKEEQRFGHILTGIANFFVSVLKWNDTRSFYEIRGKLLEIMLL